MADPNEPTATTERAIERWRAEHAELSSADREAREHELREELDALAEVGLRGPDAFAHAVAKVRAKGDFAWRLPATLFFAGVLFHLVGAAGHWLLEALGRLAGTTLNVGVGVGRVSQVLVLVIPPILGLAAVFRFAPTLAARPPTLGRAARIGLVVALGLFVFFAHYAPVPSSIRRLDAEGLRALNAWYAAAAPTYRLVWRVFPFALAFATIAARRLATRGRPERAATFWMLTGLLVYDVASTVASSATVLSLRIAHHAALGAGAVFPMAVTVSLAVAAALAVVLIAVARRLPSPRVILASRATDVAAVAVALASLPFAFRYQLWPTPLRDPSIVAATLQAQSMLGAAFDLTVPPVLGAIVAWLAARVSPRA